MKKMPDRKTLLITGFEPFGGETINPAWEAVKHLDNRIGRFDLVRCLVPVVFGKAGETVIKSISENLPDIVICVGQAGGRSAITPEMVAINLRYASTPDNAGLLPKDEPVVPGAPAAYFSTLPVRAMAERMKAAGIAAAVSYTAGAYVCNDLMYSVLHAVSTSKMRAGFIHVPFLPVQAKEHVPCMPLEEIIRGLTESILAL